MAGDIREVGGSRTAGGTNTLLFLALYDTDIFVEYWASCFTEFPFILIYLQVKVSHSKYLT